MPLRPLKVASKYSIPKTKLNTLYAHFQKFNDDLHKGYKEIFMPFKLLIKKSRERKVRKKKEEENDKELEDDTGRRRRLLSMEMDIKRLEQHEIECN